MDSKSGLVGYILVGFFSYPIFPFTWPHAGPLVNRKTVDCSEFRTRDAALAFSKGHAARGKFELSNLNVFSNGLLNVFQERDHQLQTTNFHRPILMCNCGSTNYIQATKILATRNHHCLDLIWTLFLAIIYSSSKYSCPPKKGPFQREYIHFQIFNFRVGIKTLAMV